MKKLIALTLGFLLTIAAVAQDNTSEKKYARPDIPGTFVVEWGLNHPFKTSEKFSLGTLGSRTVNIYYQYDMRILKSKFSFHPGIGVSLERYKFKNNYALGYSDNGDTLTMKAPSVILPFKKSQLVTDYVEVPLEFRFSGNPEDPTRSFKISVGVRFGYLIKSYTKTKYKEDGETIKQKNNRNFNLNEFRYGVYGKVGAGNFSFFAYYNLTPLFKTGKGPVYKKSLPMDMQNFTVGISLASF